MLGNDIVDLRCPFNQRSAANPRFVERVLSPLERALIRTRANPARWLWLFWAVKEALFKARSGFGDPVGFSPRQLCIVALHRDGMLAVEDAADDSAVAFAAALAAVVTSPRNQAPDHWQLSLAGSPDYIHCVVSKVGVQPNVGIDRLAPNSTAPTDAVRRLARRLARDTLALSQRRGVHITSRRSRLERPWVAVQGDVRRDALVSLSHDGRFVAAAVATVT